MEQKPFKLRVRQVREDVHVDLLVQTGRSRWSVVESINRGPVTLEVAILGLGAADLSKLPRMAAALATPITDNTP